jgi:hypothetical protein
MRRAFIFTADALFALMMLGAVALMFSVHAAQPEYSARTALLQALAYDYAALSQPPVNLDEATFRAKTGLEAYSSEDAVPGGRQMVVRATKYHYNNSCNEKDCAKSCRITKADAEGSGGYGCLANQALERFGIVSARAWVATP